MTNYIKQLTSVANKMTEGMKTIYRTVSPILSLRDNIG